jgi:CheY-like chemotaxis protein
MPDTMSSKRKMARVGIKLYRENPADLVITDIIMPEKEGIELIIELRRDFPYVKIIAVSGGGQRMESATCLSLAKGLGAVRTLAKPSFDRNLWIRFERSWMRSDPDSCATSVPCRHESGKFMTILPFHGPVLAVNGCRKTLRHATSP